MRLFPSLCVFVGLYFMTILPSGAQENGPAIIPERVQELALKLGIPERIGLNWNAATSEQVGRYMGILASANEVAKEIALKNGRKEALDDDYRAAFSIQCMWPPNKPPIIEEYWSSLYPAYYSADVRQKLREAIGPEAIKLPAMIQSNRDKMIANPSEFFPSTKEEYFKTVFNIKKVLDKQ